MNTLKQIEEFLQSPSFAVAGVSRNPRKFGHTAFRELISRGMNAIPVNPEADEILGHKVFAAIENLPAGISALIVLTPSDRTEKIVKDALGSGFRQIWIQQKSECREATELLKDSGINYITGECILMHFRPNGVHKFHRSINRLFGKYPK
jgi:uncharacterized protein